jgi:DNA-binding Lrp family transcriptional regulator
MSTLTTNIPVTIADPINARILAVSEDQLQGFVADPFGEIAHRAKLPIDDVLARVRAMLEAGTIRRVRQTLMSVALAPGSLIAWEVPEEKLHAAFDWMFQHDPFTGHVVIRSTDAPINGAKYRLWTTLKIPRPFSMERHCEFLCAQTGALRFKLMPAKKVFALGVGHMRRKAIEPGSRAEELAEAMSTRLVELDDREWRVLTALKRELAPEEIALDVWQRRADKADVPLGEFVEVAKRLEAKGVLGRFSTFLEHFKQLATGERVTKFNALFHWAVPEGREMEAGQHVGSFDIMTHAYWREGGPEFCNVNIMGVAHGTDKARVLEHKAAIDAHLERIGIPVSYTNVFWGGRSEIKPSEISPLAYREWSTQAGLDSKMTT